MKTERNFEEDDKLRLVDLDEDRMSVDRNNEEPTDKGSEKTGDTQDLDAYTIEEMIRHDQIPQANMLQMYNDLKGKRGRAGRNEPSKMTQTGVREIYGYALGISNDTEDSLMNCRDQHSSAVPSTAASDDRQTQSPLSTSGDDSDTDDKEEDDGDDDDDDGGGGKGGMKGRKDSGNDDDESGGHGHAETPHGDNSNEDNRDQTEDERMSDGSGMGEVEADQNGGESTSNGASQQQHAPGLASRPSPQRQDGTNRPALSSSLILEKGDPRLWSKGKNPKPLTGNALRQRLKALNTTLG